MASRVVGFIATILTVLVVTNLAVFWFTVSTAKASGVVTTIGQSVFDPWGYTTVAALALTLFSWIAYGIYHAVRSY